MKFAHNVKLSVFAYEDEDPAEIGDALLSLVPFDIVKEKVELKRSVAEGFDEKKIVIFEIFLEKSSHVSKFVSNLVQNISEDQRQLLLSQSESRLDKDLYFFIRLDKDELVDNKRFVLTDSGNCFHIRIAIAAYPAKRDRGLRVVEQMLTS